MPSNHTLTALARPHPTGERLVAAVVSAVPEPEPATAVVAASTASEIAQLKTRIQLLHSEHDELLNQIEDLRGRLAEMQQPCELTSDNETDEQLAERLQAQWRAERQTFVRNEELRRRAIQPRRRTGLQPVVKKPPIMPLKSVVALSYRPDEKRDDRIIPGDDVHRWLLDRGLIKHGPDGKGWARLKACPWQADHDRNASEASQHAGWRTGRFGSFHCFGCRRTTRDFLLWLHGVDPVFPGIVRYALAFGWELRHA